MEYDDAPELVRSFFAYKTSVQNRSKLTIFQYYHDLRTFFRYILLERYPEKYSSVEFSEIPFSDVTNEIVTSVTHKEIYNFTLFASGELENKASARARKLSTLRMFYKFLMSVAFVIKENPAANLGSPKKPKTLPKFMTLDESTQLLESVDGKSSERDYAIITLFLNCGLRVSELAGINISRISRDFTRLNVIGKGNKERVIYLNDACVSAIKAYLAVRPNDVKAKDKDALFISRNRNRISIKTVQWLIYKYLDKAGLGYRKLSVHKLRHTAATLMYQYGHVDVRVLKDILGHEDLSTTQIYTHVSDEQMQSAMDKNPLASKKPPKKMNIKPDNVAEDDE